MTQTPPNVPFDQQDEQSPAPQRRSLLALLREINARMVVGVVAALALIVFIAQNISETRVSFLGWEWDLPLFLLLLITVGLSVVCAEILRWYLRRRPKRQSAAK